MPVPVISVAQMREWEKATWASGQSEEAVMRLAGQAVARRAEQLTQPGDFILVLSGKGHNGDDARLAAESISGREARVLRVLDPEAIGAELAPLLARRPALIIDGLFGIGLNRPLAAAWIKLIQKVNQSGTPILAVDTPSGLNADTGMPLDDAVRATVTVTLGAVKQGFLKSNAWPFVGRLEVAPDIGLIPYPFTTEINMVAPGDFTGFPPPRPPAGHKGTFGHLVIIAGSQGYHGAAVLAARGAQRAQPGLITLLTAPKVYEPVARQLQAVMVKPWSDEVEYRRERTGLAGAGGLPGEGAASDHAAPGRGGALAANDQRGSSGGPAEGLARSLQKAGRVLGRFEGPPDVDRAEEGGVVRELLGQSAPGAGRQRRFAGRFPGRFAGAAGVASRDGQDHPLRGLATRRGGGCAAGQKTELDSGRAGR